MKKQILLVSFFVSLFFIFVTGCNTTSEIETDSQGEAEASSDIGIVYPEPEPLGPLPEHMEFEDVVKSKVWYSKLQEFDGLKMIYQEKLQFNTTSKTFEKETFYWERYGRTNTYKFAGSTIQVCDYFYGLESNLFEYKIKEYYNIDPVNGRLNNDIEDDRNYFPVEYDILNRDIIHWGDNTFYNKRGMEKNYIGDFTTQREFILNL